MDTTTSHSRLVYRPDIDGLRAIAVLAVLFCHAGLGFPGGYVGVDVFFVLSGFLITSLILKDLQQGKFSLTDFWDRRIRRIFPALFAVVLATLVAGWFLLLPSRYRDLARSVLALVLMVSNFYFWRTTGYFEAAAEEKPLLHTWSLAVEEQFYLLVPLGLILLARTNRLQRSLPLLASLMALSFGWSVYGVHTRNEATFFLLPSRAWELLVGASLAFLAGKTANGPARFGDLLSGLGLVGILAPCFLYTENTPFPGLAAAPPVLGTALVIWCGMRTDRVPFLNRFLATKPVVFVGLISYSLYLWHWPLFALAKSQLILPLGVAGKIGLVAASLVLAVASWRWIETPFRKRQILAPRPALLRAATACVVVLCAAGGMLTVFKGFEGRLPAEAQRFAASSRVDPRFRPQVDLKDIPGKLPVFGNRTVSPSFLIWGDSHAMAILPALSALCDENGISAVVATHSGTAPVLEYARESGLGLGQDAIPFNHAVFEYLRSRKLKVVVLAARWSQYFPDAQFPAALQQTVNELRKNGISVYLVSDLEFPFDVPKALALYVWRGWDYSRLGLDLAKDDSERQQWASFLANLQRPGVTVLDPVPIFQARTGTREILPYDAGGSFYRDRDHLSTYGALALKPLFAPLLAEVLPEGTSPARRQTSSETVMTGGEALHGRPHPQIAATSR